MKTIATILALICYATTATATVKWSFKSTALDSSSRENVLAQDDEFESIVVAKAAELETLLHTKPNQEVVLPLPDGTLHSFRVQPNRIMSEKLLRQYPTVRSFEGTSTTGFSTTFTSTSKKNEIISVVFSVAKTANGTSLYAQYTSNKRGHMVLQTTTERAGDVEFHVASRETAMAREASPEYSCNTEPEEGRRLLEELLHRPNETIEMNRRKLQDANCQEEKLGDFQCDPENNRPECNFDAGDCCGGFAQRFGPCESSPADPGACTCRDPGYLVVRPRTFRLAVAANVEFFRSV